MNCNNAVDDLACEESELRELVAGYSVCVLNGRCYCAWAEVCQADFIDPDEVLRQFRQLHSP